jgi:NADH dehydrogenase
MSAPLASVTVFGGSGFLGHYVVKRLAKRGYRIIIPTRDPEKALSLKPNGTVGQIVPFVGDIGDETFVRRAVKGADAVINLIGILYESQKHQFQQVQGAFPGFLGRIAKEEGVTRLVHLSALGADAHSPSAYARSKVTGEKNLLSTFPAATILRPSVMVAPEDNFINRFAALSLVAPALPLIGGGKTRFQPVYAGDVADAIIAALLDERAQGRIYEIGGPAVYSFKELLQLMLKEIGRKRFLVSLPFWFASLKAFFLQMLPNPMLTVDQVKLLRQDNVVSGAAPGLKDLGITPTAIETILPTYLDKYREGGRFAPETIRV